MGLRNENATKKVNLDIFCERLGTYIMKVYTNGEDIFIFTSDLNADPVASFEKENKPINLTEEENKSEVSRDIKRE